MIEGKIHIYRNDTSISIENWHQGGYYVRLTYEPFKYVQIVAGPQGFTAITGQGQQTKPTHDIDGLFEAAVNDLVQWSERGRQLNDFFADVEFEENRTYEAQLAAEKAAKQNKGGN